jgi:polyglycine hydrolase-like protein
LLTAPWTSLNGKALPMATILVWPPHPIGNWTYNGIDGPAYQRVFDHFVDSREMADTVSCKNNGATYDSTWIPAKGSWISYHGMTIADHAAKNAKLTRQGYKQTSVYTCGSVMVAIWRKP